MKRRQTTTVERGGSHRLPSRYIAASNPRTILAHLTHRRCCRDLCGAPMILIQQFQPGCLNGQLIPTPQREGKSSERCGFFPLPCTAIFPSKFSLFKTCTHLSGSRRHQSDRREDERTRAEVFAKQEQTTVCSAQEPALWQQSVFPNHASTTKEALSQTRQKLSSFL